MVKRSCLRAASFSTDHEKSRVLLRWAELVLRAPMSETKSSAESNKCFVTIADASRSKATSTLKTRASFLVLYFSWRDANLSDTDFLPFREPQLYAQEVVGMEGATECVVSARCRGAALKMYLGKRPANNGHAG